MFGSKEGYMWKHRMRGLCRFLGKLDKYLDICSFDKGLCCFYGVCYKSHHSCRFRTN